MNAIPCESRTPLTGRSGGGEPQGCRDHHGTADLSFPGSRLWSQARRVRQARGGRISGTRHATKAGRGVPVARLTAQGRVGHRSRHIALHRASHRLLSARTSAHPSAAPPFLLSPARPYGGSPGTIRQLGSRRAAQSPQCLPARIEARGTKLVSTGVDARASARGKSRGKGVLAA